MASFIVLNWVFGFNLFFCNSAWALWSSSFKIDKVFPLSICSEMKEVCAELRHIELDLSRVSISHDFEFTKDLIMVFTSIEHQNDVEYFSLVRS